MTADKLFPGVSISVRGELHGRVTDYCVVTIVSRAPLMLADAISITVTWFNLYRGRSKGVLGAMSLGDIILRDGMRAYPFSSLARAHPLLLGTIYFMYVFNIRHDTPSTDERVQHDIHLEHAPSYANASLGVCTLNHALHTLLIFITECS